MGEAGRARGPPLCRGATCRSVLRRARAAAGSSAMARNALAPASGNSRPKRAAANKAAAAMMEPDFSDSEDEDGSKFYSIDDFEAKKEKEKEKRNSTLRHRSQGARHQRCCCNCVIIAVHPVLSVCCADRRRSPLAARRTPHAARRHTARPSFHRRIVSSLTARCYRLLLYRAENLVLRRRCECV